MIADATSMPRTLAVIARLIPSADRQAIVGDLLEDAHGRGLSGLRAGLWLAAECGAIGLGLSIARARGWMVLPPVREVAAGLAVDGRGIWRGTHLPGAVLRALLFCGSVATLALGVEFLVGALMSASGL